MHAYDDSRYINPHTIPFYANTNEAFLEGSVRGVVVELPGLGGGSCLGGLMERQDYDTPFTRAFAKAGVVVAYMFPGPWSWGNMGETRMTDAVVDALMAKYALPADAPIVVSGGSMGGIGALNYARYSRHRVNAVAAACPCVDVLASFDCHPDFPRTYVSAVAGCDMMLEDALKAISPVEQAAHMPRIPYFICSDAEDELFPVAQCDQYVELLRAHGHSVTYERQPGQPHGGFIPEVRQKLHDFMMDAVVRKA